MTEEWRDIPGYGGRYQASSLGRIRSIDWLQVMVNGGKRLKRGRIFQPSTASNYQTVNLYLDGVKRSPTVHSLIALSFLGERPEGMVVCHNDGDRDNNSVKNLRYDSMSNNVLDTVAHGRHPEASKIYCPEGHPLSGDNLILRSARKNRRSRACRICTNANARIFRARVRDSKLNPQERLALGR